MNGSGNDCWVLTTGEAGFRSQAIGLAEAIGLDFREKQIQLRAPWAYLPGHLCPWVLAGLGSGSDPISPPWPRLLITCGRRPTALSIAIRKRSAGKTKTVHIQHPKVPRKAFDLIIPMRHDGLIGANVFPVETALHRISAQELSKNRKIWHDRLNPEGAPLLGIVLGGSNRRYRFTDGAVDELVRLIERGLEQDMKVVVTPSRRTEPFVPDALSQTFSGERRFSLWDGTGDNPYIGLLALADRLIVTCESVSMISEALATGRPVHILRLEGKGRRHEKFLDNIVQRNLISFTRRGEIDWSWAGTPPVNETPAAAAQVMRILECSADS